MTSPLRHIAHLAGIFAICSFHPIDAAGQKKASTSASAKLMAAGRAATADLLRDPASAQFRKLRVVAGDDDQKVVCGEVNGKNGYGGYVGFRSFAYSKKAGIAGDTLHEILVYLSAGGSACQTREETSQMLAERRD
ncbi:hypothetical protein [Rhizorhabdus histidinilytica]|uniref:hypothetical protein n=1 Tax=Rhizorhabdus histidinilytica TaxID=439228 RepID=UPI00321F8F30